MARSVPASVLPMPPAEYDQQYMATLVNALSIAMRQERNPGPARFTSITLTNLPTSPAGLSPGEVWRDPGDDSLKVAT